MIERVKVAGSTVTISKIGFGCGRIYAGSEIRSSALLIEAALSAGIRHFDTAPMYGLGQSEDVLGIWPPNSDLRRERYVGHTA